MAEQTLKTCSRRLYDIQESVMNQYSTSIMSNPLLSKMQLVPHGGALSTSASAFVAAVNLAVGEIGKAEIYVK